MHKCQLHANDYNGFYNTVGSESVSVCMEVVRGYSPRVPPDLVVHQVPCYT